MIDDRGITLLSQGGVMREGWNANIQCSKRLNTNFLPADVSVSSFPGPSCWNISALLWSFPGQAGLPEPAPPEPDTPAAVCGAPARIARPNTPPSALWFDCVPQLRDTRRHDACLSDPGIMCNESYLVPLYCSLRSPVDPNLRGQAQAIKGHAVSHSLW